MVSGTNVITSAAVNPIGTVYGIGSHLAVDFLRDDISSPDAYAAAAVGGAAGESMPIWGVVIGGAASSLTNSLWFLKDYNTKSVWNQIDDWGRAFFGTNKSADLLSNILNTYLDCGD